MKPCVPAALLLSAFLVPGAFAQEKETKPKTEEKQQEKAKPKKLAPTELIDERLGIRFSITGSKIRRRIISTDTPWGFAVRSVAPGSVAAKAGIARGTVVLEIDGVPFREVRELASALRELKAGKAIKLSCAKRKKKRRLFDRKPWVDFDVELSPAQPEKPKPKKPKRKVI